MKYQPVIGLEVHLQIKTKTKMFSREKAEYFQEAPNTHISPVSFGLPGALPVPNKVAFKKCLNLALALNCKINQKTKFDRKNYFYPDLAKGYQISQYDKPIGYEGYVEIEVGDDSQRVRITRIHLEEDTGKSLHSSSDVTLIDFNKSGIPLAEIVTEPDFGSVEEVLAFAKRLRQIVRYTNTSDAEMQKGQMRFELNISLKKPTESGLPPYKVEVKNIGSISALEKVIQFEIERQGEILDKGELPVQETRGLKDMSGETLSQRIKEGSDDYRYFPEPDIPEIIISHSEIKELQENMPELPHTRRQRYIDNKLEFEQADIFIEDIARGDYYDYYLELLSPEAISTHENKFFFHKEGAKWVNGEIAGLCLKNNIDFINCPISQEDLLYIIQKINEKEITGTIAKNVFEIMITEKERKAGRAEEIIEEKGWKQKNDDGAVLELVNKVIIENQKVVDDIQKNPNAIKFLVGQVMKLSRGTVNPNIAEDKIKEVLKL